MPRISKNSGIAALGVSESLEMHCGEAYSFTGVVMTDTDPAVVQDLTGAVFTATAEWYTANVSEGTGRVASVNISEFEKDATRALSNVHVMVLDAPAGLISLELPADLFEGEQPVIDTAIAVPVCVVSIRKVQGGLHTRISRFVIVWRRAVLL